MKKTLLALLFAAASVAQAQPVPPLSWYNAPDQHLPRYNNRFGDAPYNEAAAVAGIGLIVGIVANRIETQRREELQREREWAAEEARRRIEQSPVAQVERRYVRKCTGWREVTDQYGRSYMERVCV